MAGVGTDIVASGQIRAGKLFVRNRRTFDQSVAQMREGTEVEVSVIRRRATRSVAQNRYLWGVAYEYLSAHTGYTADEIHDICKAKFLPKRLAVCDGNGEVVDEFVIGGSTRPLNKIEFSEYVESIRRWAAADLDCNIPDPNEGE